jgi:septal ring factor EnvC (AmiA/AmiB activator)
MDELPYRYRGDGEDAIKLYYAKPVDARLAQQQAEIDELEKDKVDLASQLKSLIDALTWSNKMLLDITDQHIKVKKTIEENTELISEMNASSMDRIFSNAEIKLKGIKQPK